MQRINYLFVLISILILSSCGKKTADEIFEEQKGGVVLVLNKFYYESEGNETLNIPSISEEKLNYNDNNNDYPDNIETNNVNNNSSPNITSSNPVTYRSKFVWYPLIFIIVFPIAGVGFSYLCFKDGKTTPGIICNIFTVAGIGMIFTLKCSSMKIHPNKGEIYVKIGKIYKCQKNTYKIDDVAEINIRESQIIKTNKKRSKKSSTQMLKTTSPSKAS